MSETDNNSQDQEAKTSGLAEASIVLGVISVLTALCRGGIGAVFAMAALISGILALIQIRICRRPLKGQSSAVAGMITAGAGLLLTWFFAVPHQERAYELARRMVCGSNLAGLGKVLEVYANDTGRRSYPVASKWCDLLIEGDYESKKQFVCKAALKTGDKERCHYAMNPNCEPNSPADMVLLFETKGGWNQSGGPEILTTENHGGEGCNILFNDGSVRFVKTEELGKLKWKVEETKK